MDEKNKNLEGMADEIFKSHESVMERVKEFLGKKGCQTSMLFMANDEIGLMGDIPLPFVFTIMADIIKGKQPDYDFSGIMMNMIGIRTPTDKCPTDDQIKTYEKNLLDLAAKLQFAVNAIKEDNSGAIVTTGVIKKVMEPVKKPLNPSMFMSKGGEA